MLCRAQLWILDRVCTPPSVRRYATAPCRLRGPTVKNSSDVVISDDICDEVFDEAMEDKMDGAATTTLLSPPSAVALKP